MDATNPTGFCRFEILTSYSVFPLFKNTFSTEWKSSSLSGYTEGASSITPQNYIRVIKIFTFLFRSHLLVEINFGRCILPIIVAYIHYAEHDTGMMKILKETITKKRSSARIFFKCSTHVL